MTTQAELRDAIEDAIVEHLAGHVPVEIAKPLRDAILALLPPAPADAAHEYQVYEDLLKERDELRASFDKVNASCIEYAEELDRLRASPAPAVDEATEALRILISQCHQLASNHFKALGATEKAARQTADGVYAIKFARKALAALGDVYDEEVSAPALPVPVKEIIQLYETAVSARQTCEGSDEEALWIAKDDAERDYYNALDYMGDESMMPTLVATLRQLHAGSWSGWQDISSAPKDGTHILLLHGVYKRAWAGHWREDSPAPGLNWVSSTYEHAYPTNAFSHWRPLPDAPTPREGMKQTANVSKYAGCAVVPRIRNAATCSMFITASENFAPNNATFGGTKRVSRNQGEGDD